MNIQAFTAGFLLAGFIFSGALVAAEPTQSAPVPPAPSADKPSGTSGDQEKKTPPVSGQTEAKAVWGKAEDPDKDCKIEARENQLTIKVTGGAKPHDLSAEIGTMNAPRSLQEIEGDFTMRVTVDGGFAPGGDSTQAGRSGYNGAGLLLMVDDKNYIRLERATLHWKGQEPQPYINFEMREGGTPATFGSTGDTSFKPEGPTVLRVERKGDTLLASVSNDGLIFVDLEPKKLPANWPGKIKVGFAAVSTSQFDFTPVFTQLMLGKATPVPAPAVKEAK